MIYTSANSHIGDCCWALNVLTRIYGSHKFHCPVEYHWQLHEIVVECLIGCEIELLPLETAPADALNTWIACGRFEHAGVRYENNVDMVDFLLRWSRAMMVEGGMPPTFHEREDLLFRFPAIKRNVVAPELDILVINGAPRSGQCPGWDNEEMDELISDLGFAHKVVCTNCTTAANDDKEGFITTISASLCNIGNLSLRAKLIVAVASGAHWMVHNPWRTCPLYLFLDPIRLNYGKEIPHAANVGEMRELLRAWL